MSDLRLTDLTQATGITINDLLHIVITGDTSQDPAGSSYKASVGQLYDGLSGYCVPDLYVSNLHSCSPLNINPLDEGGVYFGSTSGITLDVTNKRIGINTSTPQYALDIKGSQSNLYYDPTSVGGNFVISGSTGIPRMGMTIPAYLTKPTAGFNLGMRAWDDVTFTGYGKVGDAFFYAGNQTNGFNILNPVGTGTEDYIRFYAGQTANGTTPDMHIQGSGTTRGFVGIGTELPTEKLHISGGDMLVENTNGKYYTDIQNATGPLTILSGDSSGVSRIGVIVPTYDSITLGIRGASAVFPGYGKQGDAFIYSSNANNGFNLISSPGTGTDDYIRFYAGQTANGTTPDMHIQGSGSTRGYVGIGTEYPTEKLHISGNTKIDGGLSANTISGDTLTITDNIDTTTRTLKNVSNNPTLDWSSLILYGTTANLYWDNGLLKDSGPNLSLDWVNRTLNDGNEDIILDWQNKIMSGMTSVQSSTISASTLNISSTPTTDTGTTANYLTRDGSTGEIKVKTIPGPTTYGLFSQTGTSVAVSATTVETTLISGGVGSIIIPANGFSVGDGFHGVLIGHLSCVGSATLHIRIKTDSGVLLAETGVMAMNAATNKHWKLDVNFTIRQVGLSTVASIASGGLFSYTKDGGLNFEGVNFSLVNNTTFDTTISSTLVITAQWNTNNAGNSIYSEIFTLNKIY
jgi:hypothetical protein